MIRAVYGDTVEVDTSVDLLLKLARLKVCLRCVDTPEKGRRAKCLADCDTGRAATAFTSVDNRRDPVSRHSRSGVGQVGRAGDRGHHCGTTARSRPH